jgi:hypothetical protein
MLWRPNQERSAASETAALMIYVALIFSSEMDAGPLPQQFSAASYNDLQVSTGLSRKLVANGLARLIQLDLISPIGSHQKRRYLVVWKGATGGWFKLPCQAIVREQKIMPFDNFTLRSKHELHAMKLYLYLAARRRNELPYSVASYETIHARIGIPEKDIRKAISVLIAVGLMRSVHREHEVELNSYGPNQYFLTGCERLRGHDSDAAA